MARPRVAKSSARKKQTFKQTQGGETIGFAEAPQAAFEGQAYTSESTAHLIPALRNLKPTGAMPL